MSKPDEIDKLKKPAKILLIVLQISIVAQLLAFFQTKYVLVSPIIQQSVIIDIVTPFISNAIISTVLGCAALIFYFYSRFLITIILCILPLIWQQIYQYF